MENRSVESGISPKQYEIFPRLRTGNNGFRSFLLYRLCYSDIEYRHEILLEFEQNSNKSILGFQ